MAMGSDTWAAVVAATQNRRANAKGKVRANCPLCPMQGRSPDKDQSLVFYRLSGYYKCYRCSSKGIVHGYAAVGAMGAVRTVAPTTKFSAKEGPGDFTLLAGENWGTFLYGDATAYLESRRITEDIARAAHIGACLTGGEEKPWLLRGRVVVPHLRADGTWWGYTARDFTGTQPKSRRYRFPNDMDSDGNLYNEEALYKQTDDPVILVEGVFDSLLYFPDVCAGQGMPKPTHLCKYTKARRPMAFAFDGDAWRVAKAMALKMRLRGKRAGYIHLPPTTDPNDRRVDPDWVRQRARECIDEELHV